MIVIRHDPEFVGQMPRLIVRERWKNEEPVDERRLIVNKGPLAVKKLLPHI